jgi:molybdenum cofactor cytidylyltransferase
MSLDDQHGAKKIIQQHTEQVEQVDFPDGAIDIDTLADYQNVIRQLDSKQKSHL